MSAHPPPTYTLDQLVVLEAIDRHGSFVAAARALHRVPSAVTYAVNRLEEAVGVPLFTRAGHHARPTSAGRRVLEEARGVLEHARRLDQVARSLKEGWEPVLSVVIDGVHPLEPVMRAVAAFNALDVPTRVRIHVEYQSGVAARFDTDAADLMLMLEFDGTGAWEAALMRQAYRLMNGQVTDQDLIEVRRLYAHPLPGLEPRARTLLGQYLLALQRHREVLDLLDPLLEKEPTIINHFQLGAALAGLGEREEARALLKAGLEADHGDLDEAQAKGVKAQIRTLMKELDEVPAPPDQL